MVLAEWCLAHGSQLAGRCVLELGSGCGLTGLVAAVAGGASQVVLTDGHEEVLQQLSHNVRLNLPPPSSATLSETEMAPAGYTSMSLSGRERARASAGDTSVSVLHLPWEEVASAEDLPAPDIILAAGGSLFSIIQRNL